MKNTILKYDTEELVLDESEQVTYEIPDYFSQKIFISDLSSSIDGWDDYLDTYRMADNDKLERVSYELYGTPDYWDIILMLNERSPLFDMPYDFDTLSNETSSFINTYANFIYIDAPLDQDRVDALTEEYVNDSLDENETFRYIQVVKPSRISEFILLLKTNGYA